MPYVVPTAAAPSSPTSSAAPASPHSIPPISLSIAYACPAPVPAHTPFMPFARPFPPPLASSSAQAGSSAMGYIYPPPSDSSSASNSISSSLPTQHLTRPRSPSMRRTASASSASPATSTMPSAARYANAAGRGLPHIPRRRGASVSSIADELSSSGTWPSHVGRAVASAQASQSTIVSTSPARGRPRSRFVLGGEKSGSDEEKSMAIVGKSNGKKTKGGVKFISNGAEKTRDGEREDMDVEERAARKRPVSADRTRALKTTLSEILTSSLSNRTEEGALLSEAGPSIPTEHRHDHSDSGSECPTPTPASVARGRREVDRALRGSEDIHVMQSTSPPPAAESTESSIPGIAPRARIGRGREGSRRRNGLTLADEGEGKDVQPVSSRGAFIQDETSTVAFPLSNPPSPPPALPFIASASPTPETTPISSPPQPDKTAMGIARKKRYVGPLHIDLDGAAAYSEAGNSHPEFGRHASYVSHEPSYSPPAHAPLSPGNVHSPPMTRALSESASTSCMPLIRKKSGEVLKSSLKSRSSSTGHRPSLSLSDLSSIPLLSPSISEPATPSAAACKMVHFDAKLEHVRLFLAEQKPAAVSRDGSPTFDDTTSGGEGDSGTEWDISGPTLARPRPRRLVPGGAASDEEAAVRRVLMMRVLNMPARSAETASNVDVLLEGLHLADDAASVQGTVRVRNIAFEKSVVVRFTFDGWQTTSEVIARWAESCARSPSMSTACAGLNLALLNSSSTSLIDVNSETQASDFDRFAFSIRLADMLLRIDEKTLVLAVRYHSAGREMWDNNGGQNYRAVFERRAQSGLTLAGSAVVAAGSDASKSGEGERRDVKPSLSLGSASLLGSDGGRTNALGVNLHGTPDKVMAGKGGLGAKGGDGAMMSPTKRAVDPLASRYDLGASLKNPAAWRSPSEHSATWGGRGHGRDAVFSRSALHWPTKKKNEQEVGKPSIASAGFYSKTLPFESHHNVNFSDRQLACGSPRDHDADMERFSSVHFGFSSAERDAIDHPVHRRGSTGTSEAPGATHIRNHHRSYFDAWASSYTQGSSGFGNGKARLTPPGTAGSHRSLSDSDASQASSHAGPTGVEFSSSSSPARFNSFPPMGTSQATGAGHGVVAPHPWASVSHGHGHDVTDSEVSTPSITSSPTSPPDFAMLSPMVQNDPPSPDSSSTDSSSYNIFLNKFCFYTGREGALDFPMDMRRSHSASSVEEMLSSPSASSVEAFPFFKGPIQFYASMSPRATTPTMPSSPGTLSPGDTTPTSAGLLKSETSLSASVHG